MPNHDWRGHIDAEVLMNSTGSGGSSAAASRGGDARRAGEAGAGPGAAPRPAGPACRLRAAQEDVGGAALLDDAAGLQDGDASAISATTPMSWVIMTMASAETRLELAHQLQDLRLHGDVERRGSARRRSAPSAGRTSAMAIITRWRMPPESSCGCCASRRRRLGDVHGVEHVVGAQLRGRGVDALMRPDGFDQLGADRHHRLSEVIGS